MSATTGLQDNLACENCGNEDTEYKCSDRHRGYYECGECGNDIVVDYYA